ncbi:uncharacterized protein L3040_004684 [Drepanopeziza brunnea f. sp. 'multigermtubi']|uniref:uncharacterized protein n=1 Tax=Drepanopeziza brunnea f. sp. 'multigermtubi' TaxID=698441 RepID=UPI00239F25C4|nr:hypothetical protein L3040_004684 [Drepanopeziza brunnea f. sp. 'multigermtubi']
MDTVLILCTKCNSELARFRNSWNGIGNTYHSPVYPPVSISGLETTGDVYNGAPNSAIEHSLLQDIACETCHTVVGLRCDSAPKGHLLKENQLILRLTDMAVIAEETGQRAKISILKTFPLTTTSKKRFPGGQRASTAQPYTRRHQSMLGVALSNEQTMVARRPTPSDRAAPLSVSVAEIVKFKNWAEDAILTQQKDIERITGTVNRIDQDMQSLKAFMLEVRSELSSNRQLPATSAEDDVQALREDLENLRQQIVRNGKTISLSALEVVSQEVEEISQKFDGVDTLRSELQKMTARVKHLEESRHPCLYRRAPSSKLESPKEPVSGPSKRKHSQLEVSRNLSEEEPPLDPSPKRARLALSSLNEDDQEVVRDSEESPGRQPPQDREIIEILSSDADHSSPVRGQEENSVDPNPSDGPADYNAPVANQFVSSPAHAFGSGNTRASTTKQKNVSATATRPVAASRIEIRIPYSPDLALLQQRKRGRHHGNQALLFGDFSDPEIDQNYASTQLLRSVWDLLPPPSPVFRGASSTLPTRRVPKYSKCSSKQAPLLSEKNPVICSQCGKHWTSSVSFICVNLSLQIDCAWPTTPAA